jgi:hypothetical protein
VPSRIEERTLALQERYKACQQHRNCNEHTVRIIAESWAEKGEKHRAIAFDIAHSALREAARKGLPIGSWRDADLADRTARRAAMLDSEEKCRIEIGMALINARLEKIDLPKDALPDD